MEERILAQQGYDVHYYVAGRPDGEPILFLHPAFADHSVFYRQIDFFAERYRVLTMDMVGHGKSQVGKAGVTIDATSDHIAEILALQSCSSCHLVGVSMGSLMAQDFAVSYGQKARSVTVVGGYSIFGGSSEIRRAQSREMLKMMLLIIFSIKLFREYVTSTTVIRPEERAVFRRSAESFTRSSFRVMTGMGGVLRRNEQPLGCPLLIVAGDHDLEVLRRAAEQWHRKESGSELHVISDAGHCANMDHAEEFNAILSRFLAKHASA